MDKNKHIQFIGVQPETLIDEIVKKLEQSLLTKLENRQSEKGKTYLSAQQVCERFGISKPTIHEWRKRDILKPHKLGSRVYYRLDEIENAMITLND